MSNAHTSNSKVFKEKQRCRALIKWLQLFIDSTDPIADGLVDFPKWGLCSNSERNIVKRGARNVDGIFHVVGVLANFLHQRNPDKYGSCAYPIWDTTRTELTSKEQYYSDVPLYEGEQLRLRKVFAQDVIDSLNKYNLVTLGLLTQEEYDNED